MTASIKKSPEEWSYSAKAFDKVWHEALIVKLHRAEIPPYLIELIDSYVTDRTFTVRVNNTYSTFRNIKAGVPQGSVLGPALFNIYMLDLPDLPKIKVAQYADDTAIYI